MTAIDRPDIFVFVADCVSAEGLQAVRSRGVSAGRLAGFLGKSISPPRMATVAPWTLPSHASLLTGLYPWEMYGGSAKYGKMDAARATLLPSVLKHLGYRTLSLSANCLISPTSGLTQDFDLAGWGRWWDIYLRDGRKTPPHEFAGSGGTLGSDSSLKKPERPNPLLDLAPLLARKPEIGSVASRVVQQIRYPNANAGVSVGTWIEPTLDRWLATQPAGDPVFCFVNIMDAHEPYYDLPTDAAGGYFRRRLPHTRQDRVGWLLGRWSPTAEQQRDLLQLYQHAIGTVLRRLEAIISIIAAHRQWDRALAVLTSDHGQSFGGRDPLFHSQGVSESLLRVPLHLKIPGLEPNPLANADWVSLIDIVPTILRGIGVGSVAPRSGMALQDLPSAEGDRSVFAYSTGLDPARARHVSSSVRQAIDGLRVVGYRRSTKVTVGPGPDDVQVHDLRSDPRTITNLWPATDGDATSLVEQVRRLYAALLAAGSTAATTPAIEERLRSWGY